MTPPRDPAPLPDRGDIIDFIRDNNSPVGKREIGRAFHLSATDGKHVTSILRQLEDEGVIRRERNRRYVLNGEAPPVLVAEVAAIDEDGIPVLTPINPEHAASLPEIRLAPDRRNSAAPGRGDRLLVRISHRRDGPWARIIRRLEKKPGRIFGVFRPHKDGGRVEPVSRKHRSEFLIATENTNGAEDGDVVICEPLEGRVFGLQTARVVERLGIITTPGVVGDLALATNEIPIEFPKQAVDQARKAGPAPMERREDLRGIGLVTIDDEDARDFDDAVWAAPLSDDQGGGWRIIVVIADVSWYVRPGDALDEAARERGNSVYLPDRVVPMLPEELSNGLCSLVPQEDRPCLAVEMTIGAEGQKKSHRFMRAMMRSAARLTYRQIDKAFKSGGEGAPVPVERQAALYGAYDALVKARKKRGAIDLELPERRIILDDKGNPKNIITRDRLDSHKLIEEFMILANICAAETLQERGWPCMFRIHEDPAPDRVVALRDFLKTLNLRLAGGQAVRPLHFAQLIEKLGARRDAHGIQQAILRTQSQAVYSPDNIGHFGLALRDYAHFTSPIRRYSDLLVHRALIGACEMGSDGMRRDSEDDFEAMGKHLSMTERRAMSAERDAYDRYAANFLADREGETMTARVTGVERFGLFVELAATGADALLPVSALGQDRFRFDETSRALVGIRSRERFTLGDELKINLESVDVQTGSIAVTLTDRTPAPPGRRNRGRGHGKGRGKGGGKPRHRGKRRR